MTWKQEYKGICVSFKHGNEENILDRIKFFLIFKFLKI